MNETFCIDSRLPFKQSPLSGHYSKDSAHSCRTNLFTKEQSRPEIVKDEHFFQIMADHAMDWIYMEDRKGNFIYVSPSCKNITGYEPQRFIEDPQFFFKILHPEDRAAVKERVNVKERVKKYNGVNVKERVKKYNEKYRTPIEFRILHKNEDIRWISHICKPVYDQEGNFMGRRGSNRDITSQKIAEIALFESEKRFHSAVHSSHDGIALIDKEGKVIYWNKAASDIFGFKYEQMLGQSISKVIPQMRYIPEKDIIKELDLSGKMKEFAGKDRNKNEIPVEISVSKDESAGTYYCAIIRDITIRKANENKLKEKAEQLRRSNELKDVFTDILRHDLLNPAGIIKGFAEVMLMQEDDPGKKEKMEIIIRNNNKLIKLIEDASSLSKLESSKQIQLETIDLGMIVNLAAGNIRYIYEEKGMRLKVNTEGIYPCLANSILDEVFANLLSNAQKYSPEGSTVSVDILD